jgi:ribonuclease PH
MSTMRVDQRLPNQARPVRITPNYLLTAEGSALIEMGNTRVVAAASVENTVPAFLRGAGKGWITAEYAMLPRSTVTRTPRESVRGKISGRTHEIQRLVGRSLRAVADLTALSERTIIVDCDVLQADGGTRTASITGAFVALGLALQQMVTFKTISRMPLTDYVAAISVGMLDGTPVLDLCYDEDSRAGVDMNVIMTGSGRFVEIQATAEHALFDQQQMSAMIELAAAGIRELIAAQRQILML